MTPEATVGLLRELVEIESPTGTAGVRVAAEWMAERLEALGGTVAIDDGDHLRADFPGAGDPLVVVGHTDTVWAVGTLERLPVRVEGGKALGPGVYDMKAGLVTILAALAEPPRPGDPPRRAVRVLLTADEERGSLTARPAIAAAARGAAAALVLEPCLPGGGVKLQRKGIGRFRLTVHGRAAHAGTQPSPGISAIEELARQVVRLHALADPARGISVNVGVIRGGTAENVIADRAEAHVDVRIARGEHAPELEAALHGLVPEVAGARHEWSGEWTRPPLESSPGAELLFAAAARHAAELGLVLQRGGSGGGSDGNLIGALGVPVLDGLGPDGGGAHAVTEHVLLASVPQRAHLLARLLVDPGL
jgi:glutamate carboxypeptidase